MSNHKIIAFLNHYMHKDDYKYYQSITELSKNKNTGNSLIGHSLKMLDMDELSKYVNKNVPIKDKHTSADALEYYMHKGKLNVILIEFKEIDINTQSNDEILSEIIVEINGNNSSSCKHHIDNLERMKDIVKKETTELLRIKAFETLFSIIPHLYSLYENDKDEMMKYLFHDCSLKFMFVSNINSKSETPNNSNRRLVYSRQESLRASVKTLNRMKIEPFSDVILCSDTDFLEVHIPNFEKFKTKTIYNYYNHLLVIHV